MGNKLYAFSNFDEMWNTTEQSPKSVDELFMSFNIMTSYDEYSMLFAPSLLDKFRSRGVDAPILEVLSGRAIEDFPAVYHGKLHIVVCLSEYLKSIGYSEIYDEVAFERFMYLVLVMHSLMSSATMVSCKDNGQDMDILMIKRNYSSDNFEVLEEMYDKSGIVQPPFAFRVTKRELDNIVKCHNTRGIKEILNNMMFGKPLYVKHTSIIDKDIVTHYYKTLRFEEFVYIVLNGMYIFDLTHVEHSRVYSDTSISDAVLTEELFVNMTDSPYVNFGETIYNFINK